MTEIKFRQYYGGKMWYMDTMFVGVGQIGFSDEHYVDLNADDHDHEQSKIMQYTGLKDKNGKEIYESDLLRLYFDVKELADWLWLQLTDEQKKNGYLDIEVKIPDIYQNALPEKIEIIGNIYENPELLK